MFWKINDKLTLRFFERVETDHQDRLVTETGMVIGDRLHTIVGGIGSPLVSARDPEVTGPIVKDFTDKSKDTPTDTQSEDKSEDPSPSEETEDDTPVTPVAAVPVTEAEIKAYDEELEEVARQYPISEEERKAIDHLTHVQVTGVGDEAAAIEEVIRLRPSSLSQDEPKASFEVETPHDEITRKGEEALDQEDDDGTGQTFMD